MTFNIGNQISGFLKTTQSVPRGWADTLASHTQHMRVFIHLGEEETDGAVLGISESHIRCHEADASSLGVECGPRRLRAHLPLFSKVTSLLTLLASVQHVLMGPVSGNPERSRQGTHCLNLCVI